MNLSKHVFNFCFQYNEYRNSGTINSLTNSIISLGMESTKKPIGNVLIKRVTTYSTPMNSYRTEEVTQTHGTLS